MVEIKTEGSRYKSTTSNSLKRFPEPGISCMLQWPWIVLLEWRSEIKPIVLWDVTSCSVAEIYRLLGKTAASIFRVGNSSIQEMKAGFSSKLSVNSHKSSVLKNVAAISSERYVNFYQTQRRHVPEDGVVCTL